MQDEVGKIDDTQIGQDEKGHYKIFESVESPEDPESEDRLSEEFLSRTKLSQIKILLAEVKKHISTTEEAFIKIDYVKKLYATQLKKLVASQRSLKEKEIELEIKNTELQIKDDHINRQNQGNVENLTLYKE